MNQNLKNLVLLLIGIVVAVSVHSAVNPSPVKDFRIKGFHLDLRIQVMKPEALKKLAQQLSEGGVNTLIMEYEASFPFDKHPLISNRYAYTKSEIADFVKYCSAIGIDVIPLQQTFGHVEYILRYPQYAALRESGKDYSQVNPLRDTLCRELFKDLILEMTALHPSKYFHIGCDETRLLGHSMESKLKAEKYGIGKLYGDYVKMICDLVLEMGKIPVLWADIALKYPESLKLLPREVILVDWNYGWQLSRFGDHQKLVDSGLEIWGAPALRSSPDNYNLTTWDRHFSNISNFIPNARELGYTGIIMTSWSTSGLYSYLYESASDIIDLYAVRRVYPLTGFNLLLSAYFSSIAQSTPLNVDQFVARYTSDRYGFNETQSMLFLKALYSVPYEVVQGKVTRSKNLSLEVMVDSVRWSQKTLRELKPVRNLEEFEHYRIMAQTRTLYMEYQHIEQQAGRQELSEAGRSALADELKGMISKCEKLNNSYIRANAKAYYASELMLDNETRISKMKLLYHRLARIR